jgi:pimeloyl-ACP methyl ester carboxylesterase
MGPKGVKRMAIGTVRSRGHSISYEDHGGGLPLVLVPGLGSPACEWTDRGYIEPLAQRYRVLVVDPLGHGLSDVPSDPGDYLLPDVGDDIVAVLDAVGVDRAALWGYSRGSSLVSVVAVEAPERVAALVLGGCFLDSGEPDFDVSPASQAMLEGDWERAFQAWADGGLDFSQEDRNYMVEHSHPQGVAGSMLGSNRSRYRIDPSRISQPVLAYYGSGDMDGPQATALCAALRTDPIVLPGKHDHAEAFNDSAAVLPSVLSFLDRTLASAG